MMAVSLLLYHTWLLSTTAVPCSTTTATHRLLLILVLDIHVLAITVCSLLERTKPTKPADLTGRSRTVFVGTSPTCVRAVCVCVCCWDAWISMGQGNDRALPANASHRCCDNQQNTPHLRFTMERRWLFSSLTTCTSPPPTLCPPGRKADCSMIQRSWGNRRQKKENDLRTSGRIFALLRNSLPFPLDQ